MTGGLAGSDLPGFWGDADDASRRGQKWVLIYSAARLIGSVVAALGGALSISAGRVDVAAVIVLLGFAVAFASELALWIHGPERLWYDGRALAESTKTLAWRYAVCADPFPSAMSKDEALGVLRTRLLEVSRETTTGVVLTAATPVATDRMSDLRNESFVVRRAAYVEDRTLDQQRWYAKKAQLNGAWSVASRIVLVVAEILAIILASLRVFGGWHVNLAGVMGAFIAAGAAWVAVKQFGPLASAYSIAARELAIQSDRLRVVPEEAWAKVSADAEEAISREHTLWLASRTGKAPAL